MGKVVSIEDGIITRFNKSPISFDERAKTIYLDTLSRTGAKGRSAQAAGVSYTTVMHCRGEDERFAAMEEEALELFRSRLEGAALKRAVEGVDKGVYFRGQLCATEKKYSDRLLEVMLKRHIPEYREQVDINAKVNAGVLVVTQQAQSIEDWIREYGKVSHEPMRMKKVESTVVDIDEQPEQPSPIGEQPAPKPPNEITRG